MHQPTLLFALTTVVLSHIFSTLIAVADPQEALQPNPQETVESDRPVSRLSRLIQQAPTLYLPTQLVIGQENKFLVKGKPGSHVVLYVSADSRGATAPNGQALRVGANNAEVTGTLSEKGVAVLPVSMPEGDDLTGHPCYVDAVIWQAADYSDLQTVTLMSAEGRPTAENRLVMAQPVNTKGAYVLPAMPGLPTGLLQQVTTLSQIQQGDTRKKDLLYTGEINRGITRDQNTFVPMPGLQQLVPR